MKDVRDMEAEARRIAQMTPEARAEHDARLRAHISMLDVIDEVLKERARQIDVEGWTPEHDDEHGQGEMADAAACYAMTASARRFLIGSPAAHMPPTCWPWGEGWWKPKDRRRDLIRAAALLVAEIERLDRAALALPTQRGE